MGPSSAPGSEAFRPWLNYMTGFPGSPDCREWIVGHLSLHNHVSQFLMENPYTIYKIYVYVCISPIDSVSLENTKTKLPF